MLEIRLNRSLNCPVRLSESIHRAQQSSRDRDRFPSGERFGCFLKAAETASNNLLRTFIIARKNEGGAEETAKLSVLKLLREDVGWKP